MGRDSAVKKTLLGVASVAFFVIGAAIVGTTGAGAEQGAATFGSTLPGPLQVA